jgi:adenine/guanine phosphoribosyltransferase-like PRPP-binding protein
MRTGIISGYLEDGLEKSSARKVIRGMKNLIVKSNLKFDAIAYTGCSGALVAPTIAYLLNKHLIVVRKNEGAHSFNRVEGYVNKNEPINYIIIDDFIETGKTINTIYEKIADAAGNLPSNIILKGIFLWNSWRRDKSIVIKGKKYKIFSQCIEKV